MNQTDSSGAMSVAGKGARRLGMVLSLLWAVLMLTTVSSGALAASAIRPGFNTNTMPANDDGSTGLVPLGFNVNFFGTGYNQVYVNTNGNVTFDGPMSTYTPFTITNNTRKIIAPFFADVDTLVGTSSPVTYGTGTVGGRPAFGVNWIHVGCYSTASGGYNTFQLVLIDRSDIGAGDFDIEFNYGQIVWETGQASGGNGVCQGGDVVHVGYSNGSNASFELAGSGTAGYFLDTLSDGTTPNPTGLIYNSRNTLQQGRYLFAVRNGNAPIGHSISGTIYANDTAHPLPSSPVQACTVPGAGQDTFCSTTTANALGQYNIGGLTDGAYNVTAFAPAGTQYQSGSIQATLPGIDLTGQDITLTGPQPLPPGTGVSPTNGGSSAEPTVYWMNPLTFTTTGCTGATASYTITTESGSQAASGFMQEDPANAGHYSASVPALYPTHGWVTVTMTLLCPGSTTPTTVSFSMYIDPSGQVVDTSGQPVSGATVTLYRSDTSAGPFTPVPDGSAIMDINNRTNPWITSDQGLFGWNVLAGYYKVRAEKQGCTDPANSAQSYVESPVLTIPPPATNLQLTLSCAAPVYVPCDVNQDSAVSLNDLAIIGSRLGQTVPVGTEGDVNNDGQITTQDARMCALQCTLAGCANP